MLVPVLDKNNKPLMPCHPARARELMKKKKAKPFYQKGIFCIKLIKDPSDRKYQSIALGIDPGSKREGYTIATKNKVVINITTNTPDWVKDKIETRKNLRRSRRSRNTPYRKCRYNRNQGSFLAPSTKARWQAKLRIINLLLKLFPISIINIEDIKAISRKGKENKKWNTSFSPLEIGKSWLYSEIQKLNIQFFKTSGFETCLRREYRQLPKSSKKLEYCWEAHNVDSHILCEIALNQAISPYTGLLKIEFMNFRRRQLHLQNTAKGGIRREHGSTVSLSYSRGSILRYKKDNKLYYLGGSSKGKVSIHDIESGKRIKKSVKLKDIQIMYCNKYRRTVIPPTGQACRFLDRVFMDSFLLANAVNSVSATRYAAEKGLL